MNPLLKIYQNTRREKWNECNELPQSIWFDWDMLDKNSICFKHQKLYQNDIPIEILLKFKHQWNSIYLSKFLPMHLIKQTITELYFDLDTLSGRSDLEFDIVQKYPEMKWNYEYLSLHDDFPFQWIPYYYEIINWNHFIEKKNIFPNILSYFDHVPEMYQHRILQKHKINNLQFFEFPKKIQQSLARHIYYLDLSFVLNNPTWNWPYELLSATIPMDEIIATKDKIKWDYFALSMRCDLNPDFMIETQHKEWSLYQLIQNKFSKDPTYKTKYAQLIRRKIAIRIIQNAFHWYLYDPDAPRQQKRFIIQQQQLIAMHELDNLNTLE